MLTSHLLREVLSKRLKEFNLSAEGNSGWPLEHYEAIRKNIRAAEEYIIPQNKQLAEFSGFEIGSENDLQ